MDEMATTSKRSGHSCQSGWVIRRWRVLAMIRCILKRSTLWALSRTPYENTLYLDGDTEIMHKDISTVFDLLGDDDIMLTKIRDYRGAFVYFPGGSLEDHCGVFLYNNKPHTIKFMRSWWDLWLWQECGKWKWPSDLYPYEKLKPWDQWTYWWLMNKCGGIAIKRGYFPDPDARWNYINGYHPKECPRKDIVIYHHTINLKD